MADATFLIQKLEGKNALFVASAAPHAKVNFESTVSDDIQIGGASGNYTLPEEGSITLRAPTDTGHHNMTLTDFATLIALQVGVGGEGQEEVGFAVSRDDSLQAAVLQIVNVKEGQPTISLDLNNDTSEVVWVSVNNGRIKCEPEQVTSDTLKIPSTNRIVLRIENQIDEVGGTDQGDITIIH